MSIIAWLVLGLVSGFIASKIVDKRGKGLLANIVVGVIGAFIGGFLFHQLGARGVTGLNFWSFAVAIIGSVILLGAFHAFKNGRR